MNRALTSLNLVGVALLAGLCVWQWRVHREASLETVRLEGVRLELSAKLAERESELAKRSDDLKRFREELERALKARRDLETELSRARDRLSGLENERDALKAGIEQWKEAVAARDARLEEAIEKLRAVAEDRNDAVKRLNELVEKYNGVVTELNDRTRKFNEWVEKANKAGAR